MKELNIQLPEEIGRSPEWEHVKRTQSYEERDGVFICVHCDDESRVYCIDCEECLCCAHQIIYHSSHQKKRLKTVDQLMGALKPFRELIDSLEKKLIWMSPEVVEVLIPHRYLVGWICEQMNYCVKKREVKYLMELENYLRHEYGKLLFYRA